MSSSTPLGYGGGVVAEVAALRKNVSITPSTSGELSCPICHGGFIEEFDLPPPNPNLSPFISFELHSNPFFDEALPLVDRSSSSSLLHRPLRFLSLGRALPPLAHRPPQGAARRGRGHRRRKGCRGRRWRWSGRSRSGRGGGGLGRRGCMRGTGRRRWRSSRGIVVLLLELEKGVKVEKLSGVEGFNAEAVADARRGEM